jgi:hypothetical protein
LGLAGLVITGLIARALRNRPSGGGFVVAYVAVPL